MEVRDAITRRRSIRKYEDKPVPKEVARELFDAARLAPSGCNAQPWRFCAVEDRELVEKLRERAAFRQGFVYRAPLILVCCGDPSAYIGRHGGEYQVEEGSVPADAAARKEMFSIVEGKEALRAVRDVSIASAFLVLRAEELGLGTSYIGLIDEQVLKEVLNIPAHFVIPFVITVGYHADSPSPRPRKALGDIILC
jgi:nitroreductase